MTEKKTKNWTLSGNIIKHMWSDAVCPNCGKIHISITDDYKITDINACNKNLKENLK